MKSLAGKVAIITGGAQGIGKATVEYFLKEGAKIAIWDINEEKAKASLEKWQSAGYEVRFYAVNTVDEVAVESAAKAVVADFGTVHILINNAGITRDATLKKITMEQWKQVIDVNLTGVFNCTKAVYPIMAENGFGRILNAASVVAHNGNFGQTNYAATKAGVIAMSKTWTVELGKHGITANAIAPGFTMTDMVDQIPEEHFAAIQASIPLKTVAQPIDIAYGYLYLASDEARFVSGICLTIDGGTSR